MSAGQFKEALAIYERADKAAAAERRERLRRSPGKQALPTTVLDPLLFA